MSEYEKLHPLLQFARDTVKRGEREIGTELPKKNILMKTDELSFC